MPEEPIRPQITLSPAEARRFMLLHHHLLPPRQLHGKADITALFQRLGCIQFDPVNVIAPSPDVMLQARVADYTPALLNELLYSERELINGFDKVMSIYLSADWPYFARRREAWRKDHWYTYEEPTQIHPLLLEEIRSRGPLSSLDLEMSDKITSFWGIPIRVERAALENLLAMGSLGIHHRSGTRRYFDLIEHLLPAELLAAGDPNPTEEDYQDWHVLRRIGGLGLAFDGGTEHWLGILNLKAPQRRAALRRLTDQGRVIPATVAGLEGKLFFLRAEDLPTLEQARAGQSTPAGAALLSPLDNLLWHRDSLRWLFNFDYIWEVYKPADQVVYGHYVLPVLYGENFVARCEPALNRRAGALELRNWWWESGVQPDDAMLAGLADCLRAFCASFNARQVVLSESAASDVHLQRLANTVPDLFKL